MRSIAILALLIVIGCGSDEAPVSKTFRCPDGSTVMRIEDCRSETEPPVAQPPIEPEVVEVAKINTTGSDAKDLFDDYAKQKGLPYEYVSSEIQKEEGGVTYYRVRYSYGEGKRYVIVDTTGKVYDEFYAA